MMMTIKIEKIKNILSPTIVAQHYLGQPEKNKNNRLWYKSPFRSERTASFMVDDKSFHDFGDGWDGDIFDFIESYYNVDFKMAVNILCRDFNIVDDENYSQEFINYIKQKKDEENKIKIAISQWFNNTFSKLCDELHYIKEAMPFLKGEALQIFYDKDAKLEYLTEIFINANEDTKVELWKQRNEIEKCLY